jgi:hypothetical protein
MEQSAYPESARPDPNLLSGPVPSRRLCPSQPGLLLGTYIETLLWGFLSAGLQKNPTERKRSHVTKRIMHIIGYI